MKLTGIRELVRGDAAARFIAFAIRKVQFPHGHFSRAYHWWCFSIRN
ncbi:hypothetical protein [Granulosicoccus antarcticus]|nr:hypothetical protein [Granulosicoccus antarcticus]